MPMLKESVYRFKKKKVGVFLKLTFLHSLNSCHFETVTNAERRVYTQILEICSRVDFKTVKYHRCTIENNTI